MPSAAAECSPSDLQAERERRTRLDRALFARRDRGDLRARDELIERFMPLARSIARRYEGSSEPLDDLVQVASLALVKAVDRFDPARGCTFSSYAVPSIVGEIKRHFRDRSWAVRPPRELQEMTLRIERARSELVQRLDREPTVAELAAGLGVGDEQVLEGLQARTGRSALGLQAKLGGQDDQVMLQDTLGIDDAGFDRAEERALLARLMGSLAPRDREVLRLRFEQDLTQAQIGELLGVSQMQISRIIRQALAQLRHVAAQQEMLAERRPVLI
jgi:RNA polymerase sigma-B factor